MANWWQNNPYMTQKHAEKKPNWWKRWTTWQPQGDVSTWSQPLWFKNDNDPLKQSDWQPDPQYSSLWGVLPNGRKNQVYGLANDLRNPYLQAMSYGEAFINFNGKTMRGIDAGDEIMKINEELNQQKAYQEQARAQDRNREIDYRISPQIY